MCAVPNTKPRRQFPTAFTILFLIMLLAIALTYGGMLGKVTKLGEGYIGLEIAGGVEVQMQRSAVVQVLPKGTIK